MSTAFAALKAPTTTKYGWLDESVYETTNSNTGGLKALIESVEGRRGPSDNGS